MKNPKILVISKIISILFKTKPIIMVEFVILPPKFRNIQPYKQEQLLLKKYPRSIRNRQTDKLPGTTTS